MTAATQRVTPADGFEISFDALTLPEIDRLMALRLLATGTLTEAHAAEVLATHRRHGSSLQSILLAGRYLTAREYAKHLAELTETAYASGLLETATFAGDRELAKAFDPAALLDLLFCPVRRVEDAVLVLAVNPGDSRISDAVARVLPGTEIVPVAVTEFDIRCRVDRLFRDRLLDTAVNGLKSGRPELSASRVFTRRQVCVFGVAAVLVLAGALVAPVTTLRMAVATLTTFYAIAIAYKLAIGLAADSRRPASPARERTEIQATDLPIYSILVPVYREPEVVPTLLQALARLDYPPEKLDVVVLFEEDDAETIASAKAAQPPSFFRFIYVPRSEPRTKPKACNYGLQFCRGEFVTIYDAEDIPDPGQLKEAVRAFRSGPGDLVCVQAALNYFNWRENVLTRLFTLEYSYWFDYMLPGLDRLGLPIPLGGTSNHFPTARLRQLGAWDPFNVTEDADLGIRASAENYRIGVIDSTTYEEANSAVPNWIRQRSRWIKGYMQTWLVHNRRPLALLRTLGPVRWLSYQFFIGGTCFTFLANPVVWLLFLASLLDPQWLRPVWTESLGNVAFATFVLGNGIGIVQSMIAVCRRRLFQLLPYALLTPLYWWLHSVAAYVALWQLFTKPFYWEKTTHGLTRVDARLAVPPQAPLRSLHA